MTAPALVTKIAIAPNIVSPRVPALDKPRKPVKTRVPPSRSEGEARDHFRLVIIKLILRSKKGTTSIVQPNALSITEYTVDRRVPCLVNESKVMRARVPKNTETIL